MAARATAWIRARARHAGNGQRSHGTLLLATAAAAQTAPLFDSRLQGGRRVVVTGMGIVSCLGNTLDDVAQSLKDCKSGITKSEKYQEIGMKSHICGRPDINPDEFIDRKQTRFMGMNCKYAFIAMERAIADSGLPAETIASPRVGGILGQGGTSILDIAETIEAVNAGKNRRIGPYRVTRSMGSTVSAVLSTAFKLQGVSYSISSACSTGAHCIGVGMEQIQLGKQVRATSPPPPGGRPPWPRAARRVRTPDPVTRDLDRTNA